MKRRRRVSLRSVSFLVPVSQGTKRRLGFISSQLQMSLPIPLTEACKSISWFLCLKEFDCFLIRLVRLIASNTPIQSQPYTIKSRKFKGAGFISHHFNFSLSVPTSRGRNISSRRHNVQVFLCYLHYHFIRDVAETPFAAP